MTNEQMERAIEFLLDHHAKMTADIERHSEQIGELTQAVASLTGNVEALREEMRDGFNRLIAANEQTTRLMEQLTQLEVQNSRRITGAERRMDDIESKQ